jgi:hypothetical protein
MAADGQMFYFTSDATIKQLREIIIIWVTKALKFCNTIDIEVFNHDATTAPRKKKRAWR